MPKTIVVLRTQSEVSESKKEEMSKVAKAIVALAVIRKTMRDFAGAFIG